MRALICRHLGAPDVLEYGELPDPTAGSGEVVVDVEAAGVNFPDGLMVAGKYQTKPELPFVPGSEVAGTIRSLGPEVPGLEVGQRVTAFCGIGGYAEQVAVRADQVHALPDATSAVDAAAMPVAYGTSFHGLVDRAGLAAGETLLVLGAAGGVGLTAVEIGHALGARVIAVASTPEKLKLAAEHGADDLVNYRDNDLTEAIVELTGGAGVDVVYDPVGGAAAESAVRKLAWGGRHLTVGYASGDIPRVGMNRLLLNEGNLLGVLWGAWARRHPDRNAANVQRLLAWHGEGMIRPHIGGTWQLEDGVAALETVMNRSALGKIVLLT
ncbi:MULTISPECIES: NADPH:quinone oxidoreductase family protein [unclassified Nocardioides]|uniref:NADPH:quinone oxidoreductase family protein n=1 Tax=unclassified Nocardioides TaxID=2615069 RepID=UPI0006FD4186|nr:MULTISPECIES: NADPH:quinone oxidoreductase family protein [unclassified Nocardioides]KQY54274.1 NADPH:quinone oxidoreductase [Nocardioides sp. Root140]KQZ74896.1 NADPH:quinone oxidoreductase [Nocardioides sp. Root151]KRF10430.1 NADPH:quinone oxidoreductase [Nocardioides sp. Soil796]